MKILNIHGMHHESMHIGLAIVSIVTWVDEFKNKYSTVYLITNNNNT